MSLKLPLIIILSVGLALSGAVAGVVNKGAPQIDLDGGSRGTVPFPHQKHQNTLGDCNACHQLFPQSAGAIAGLKGEGRLADKQVMNKLCIKCHRAEKAAGKPSGPTTCNKCHVK